MFDFDRTELLLAIVELIVRLQRVLNDDLLRALRSTVVCPERGGPRALGK
jgi:hypothetical protein